MKWRFYSRKGIIGERTKKEIGIQTIRAGDIVGGAPSCSEASERIEITHKASSRDIVRGTIKGASWVSGKQQRLYDMQDAGIEMIRG